MTPLPDPAGYLEPGEVGLPQLIAPFGRVLEPVGGFDSIEGWAGNRVIALQNAVNTGLEGGVAFGVGEVTCVQRLYYVLSETPDGCGGGGTSIAFGVGGR